MDLVYFICYRGLVDRYICVSQATFAAVKVVDIAVLLEYSKRRLAVSTEWAKK